MGAIFRGGCSFRPGAFIRELKVSVRYLIAGTSVFGYLYAEVTRGYMLEHDEAKFTEKRKRVYTFAKIPKELEKVSNLYLCQCESYDNVKKCITFLISTSIHAS